MSVGIHQGSLVVCINDRFPPQVWEWCRVVPRLGHRYTVRKIKWAPDGVTGQFNLSVILEELDNPCPTGGQVSFNIRRFKPWENQSAHEEQVRQPSEYELVGTR